MHTRTMGVRDGLGLGGGVRVGVGRGVDVGRLVGCPVACGCGDVVTSVRCVGGSTSVNGCCGAGVNVTTPRGPGFPGTPGVPLLPLWGPNTASSTRPTATRPTVPMPTRNQPDGLAA